MAEQISRTLFFCTSMLNRRHAGWERERSMEGPCRKAAVFAHGSADDCVRLEEYVRGDCKTKFLDGCALEEITR